jgi:hypothetical protein
VGGRAKSIQEKGGLHESRRLQGFPSDASQKRSRVIYSGLGISVFHEGLCEFDTEFAWKVFLLA